VIPPRAGASGFTSDLAAPPWLRLPYNLGFNLVMLVVWFLGPVGAGLVVFGGAGRNTACRTLAAGVVLHLLVALGHDNTGIHSVGPIHYSDTAVPLTLLATNGFLEVVARLRRWGVGAAQPGVLLVSYAAVAYGAFGLTQALALHQEAKGERFAFDVVDEANIHQAIVLAPSPAWLAWLRKDRAGSWVVQFPHPDPYFRDDVIYAKANADIKLLHDRFPDRGLFRLLADRQGRAFVLPIDPSRPIPPSGEDEKDVAEGERESAEVPIPGSSPSAGPREPRSLTEKGEGPPDAAP
jgi:hypothetical protein